MSAVPFKGWPERALLFYEGLEADNTKAYWHDHKVVYERDVKAPMEALLAELKDEFGETHLFRPYRDTRFSHDKSPYKTAIAAGVGEGYVQLSADGLLCGAGTYTMSSDQLERLPRRRGGRRPRLQARRHRRRAGPGRAERPCHGVAQDGAQGLSEGAPAH